MAGENTVPVSPPPIQYINSVPPSGGLSGVWSTIGNLSAVAFVLVVTWTVLQWQHEAVLSAQTSLMDERKSNVESLNKLWDSVNTSNHNSSAQANTIAEMMTIQRALLDQVKSLNIQLGRNRDANLRPGGTGVEPPPNVP